MDVNEIVTRAVSGERSGVPMWTLPEAMGLTEDGQAVPLSDPSATRRLGEAGAAIPLGLAQDLGLAEGSGAPEPEPVTAALGAGGPADTDGNPDTTGDVHEVNATDSGSSDDDPGTKAQRRASTKAQRPKEDK